MCTRRRISLKRCFERPHFCATGVHGIEDRRLGANMAIFRHNVISTQARDRAHMTRELQCAFVAGAKLNKRRENLSPIARLQLSLKNFLQSVTFSLDNLCKRMYLEQNACSPTTQWSCGVVRQKHGGSINWKSPSREGLTFRTWWRGRGARCCALDLFGLWGIQPCCMVSSNTSGSETSLEGFHRARWELMNQEPNDPDHSCRFTSYNREMIVGGAA